MGCVVALADRVLTSAEPIEGLVLVINHIVAPYGTAGVSPGRPHGAEVNSRELPVKCDGLAPAEPIMRNDIIRGDER